MPGSNTGTRTYGQDERLCDVLHVSGTARGLVVERNATTRKLAEEASSRVFALKPRGGAPPPCCFRSEGEGASKTGGSVAVLSCDGRGLARSRHGSRLEAPYLGR